MPPNARPFSESAMLSKINPFMPNEIPHPYQLDESISNYRFWGIKLQFHSTVQKLISSAASDLVLHCLPMSHKNDARNTLHGRETLACEIVDMFMNSTQLDERINQYTKAGISVEITHKCRVKPLVACTLICMSYMLLRS